MQYECKGYKTCPTCGNEDMPCGKVFEVVVYKGERATRDHPGEPPHCEPDVCEDCGAVVDFDHAWQMMEDAFSDACDDRRDRDRDDAVRFMCKEVAK
jgi:hypothetical protein